MPAANEAEISDLALNRALLARQSLLARARVSPLRAIEKLVGLQAQEPQDPYVALWSRVEGFTPDKLSRLIERRQAVRIVLHRGTIHLASARDALAIRPLVAPVLDRSLQGNWGRGLDGVDRDEVAKAGRRLLAGEPLTFAQMGEALARRWPRADPKVLAEVVRARVPLVQVPPRGLWQASGLARHAPLDAWVDAKAGPLDLAQLVRRYLAAFGPASVRDAQTWCGLTKLKPVFDAIADELVTFHDARGATLHDLPRAPRPGEATPAPPRFLPVYDNLALAHHDRARILSRTKAPPVPPNALVRHVLIDGFLGARWSIQENKDGATLRVKPFAKLDARTRRDIEDEGSRLLDLQRPDARDREVKVG